MAIRNINIRARPAAPTEGLMAVGGAVFRCALGRTGATVLKREGDGATPAARLRPAWGYLRPPRASAPPALIALRPIDRNLGWCDAPADRNYNRPVRLPYGASHERMLRDDRLYDVLIVLDWNLRPRKRNRGSAIFLHIARPGLQPTEGCIAVEPAVMRRLLPLLSRKTVIRVLR